MYVNSLITHTIELTLSSTQKTSDATIIKVAQFIVTVSNYGCSLPDERQFDKADSLT